MTQLYNLLLIAHVGFGMASLILFWIPIIAKKGSKNHIRSGHWYARCMYLVAYSALILSAAVLLDPIGIKRPNENLTTEQAYAIAAQSRGAALFLFSIGLLVVSNIRHGLLTLGDKLSRAGVRSVNHTVLNIALALLALVLAYVGYRSSSVLYFVFSGLCGITAGSNLRYAWKKTIDRGDRIQSHLASMIAAGIASHTAFMVFGANQFLSEIVTGNWQLVPWIAPGVIGGIIINVLSRRYVRKPKTVRSV